MSKPNARIVGAFAAILLVLTAARAEGAVYANFDAARYDSNGFAFADFDSFFAVDTSGGTLGIDINDDVNTDDPSAGLFGGMGSDFVADFDAATTQLQVMLTVDPLNAASSFNVVLVDNDGVNTGEEYQFSFDLTGVTTGVPTLLTRSLTNPMPDYRQAADGQTDGDMIQNYGLRQLQIQSVYGGTDRLKIDVDSVKLVDPDDPLLFEFNTATYAAQTQTFSYGTFSETGVLDTSGPSFLINADPAGTGGPDGGFGFSGLNVDFDAADYQIEIEAKLLGNNTADQFNLLLGDNDGDDSAPEMGSEDYNFLVDTSNFNTSDYTTVTIPLGSGSESSVVKTYGFINGGDGLQNFGLSQMQIQASGEDPGVLGLDVLRYAIVERPDVTPGDFDEDGDVDGNDFLVWQRNTAVGSLSDWQANYGAPLLAAATSVPEPATWMLLLCALGVIPSRRRMVRS